MTYGSETSTDLAFPGTESQQVQNLAVMGEAAWWTLNRIPTTHRPA
jgi:hypothetical protein